MLNPDFDMIDVAALIRKQTEGAWMLGDALSRIKSLFPEREWAMYARKSFADLFEQMSYAEMRHLISLAETFDSDDRDHNFPLCMYSYTLRHTDAPRTWIRRAKDENWKFSELRSAVLEEKRQSALEAAPEIPPNTIFVTSLCSADNQQYATISAHVDINNLSAEPLVRLEFADKKTVLSYEESQKLEEALNLCNKEIEEYLGTAGIVVSGQPDECAEFCVT